MMWLRCLLLLCVLCNTVWCQDAKCQGKAKLDSCLQQLPPLSELSGIPSSREAINASCRAFKTGMGCIDEYARVCLDERQRQGLHDSVSGAKDAFTFLCDDPSFQREYLKYTTCYRGVSEHWELCAQRFAFLVRDEYSRPNVTRNERTLALCCAKHGFLRCAYEVSHLKCSKEAALFLKRIAETLSNIRVHYAECQGINVDICSGSGSNSPFLLAMAALLLTPMLNSLFASLLLKSTRKNWISAA